MITGAPDDSPFPPTSPRPGARSVVAAHMQAQLFTTMLGELVELTAAATDRMPADVAEWAGALLIRWAERERAFIRDDGSVASNQQ